jgi:hypothetical protein
LTNEAIRNGNAEALLNTLFATDTKNANHIESLLTKLPASDRILVGGGVGHSCESKKQPRLVKILRDKGISVTSVFLENIPVNAWVCPQLPFYNIEAKTLIKDIHQQTMRRQSTQISAPTKKVATLTP